jgi:D-glycero-D-manno-heptose 1,7-bisphosphate phosphatase
MRRAVFLDRDGVLNAVVVRDGRPYPPLSEGDLQLLPGVPEACQLLRDAGFLLIMVTNQPDIARGTMSADIVTSINDRLQRELSLDGVSVCPHDGDGCDCRKPKPGLLLEAANRLGIDLGTSYMIGDRWRDTEAAQNAGCSAIFIDYGYREQRPKPPYHRVTSLREAASWIMGQTKEAGDD